MTKTRGFADIIAYARMPDTGETVNGEPISVPRNAQTLTLYIPALASTATVKIQTLDPKTASLGDTEVWYDVYVFNILAGGVQPLTAIPGGQATTFPISALGGGVIRLVAS